MPAACLLRTGLPTHVRDAGLAMGGAAAVTPLNVANREWYQAQAEKEMAAGQGRWGRKQVEGVVSSLSALQPHYARNRAHVCAFWLRGECDKGEACPYRHEQPQLAAAAAAAAGGGASGTRAIAAGPSDPGTPPPPPADTSITTLFLGNLDPQRVTERDLRSKLDSYGTLTSVRLVPRKRCAFAEFAERADAEKAISNLFGRFDVGGCSLRLSWSLSSGNSGKSSAPPGIRTAPVTASAAAAAAQMRNKTPTARAPPPPPGKGVAKFPSQDPSQLGYAKKDAATDI